METGIQGEDREDREDREEKKDKEDKEDKEDKDNHMQMDEEEKMLGIMTMSNFEEALKELGDKFENYKPLREPHSPMVDQLLKAGEWYGDSFCNGFCDKEEFALSIKDECVHIWFETPEGSQTSDGELDPSFVFIVLRFGWQLGNFCEIRLKHIRDLELLFDYIPKKIDLTVPLNFSLVRSHLTHTFKGFLRTLLIEDLTLDFDHFTTDCEGVETIKFLRDMLVVEKLILSGTAAYDEDREEDRPYTAYWTLQEIYQLMIHHQIDLFETGNYFHLPAADRQFIEAIIDYQRFYVKG